MSIGSDHTTALLVGGELVGGVGDALPVENPYTTETIVEVQAASAEQVDAAVATEGPASLSVSGSLIQTVPARSSRMQRVALSRSLV